MNVSKAYPTLRTITEMADPERASEHRFGRMSGKLSLGSQNRRQRGGAEKGRARRKLLAAAADFMSSLSLAEGPPD